VSNNAEQVFEATYDVNIPAATPTEIGEGGVSFVTRGASYFAVSLANNGVNNITAVTVKRSPSGDNNFAPDDAMNAALAAKMPILPKPGGETLLIEYPFPPGDRVRVLVTSAGGTNPCTIGTMRILPTLRER
jgi:hypothetical protein